MLEKIKSNSWAITMILLLIVLLRQCGVNRDIDKIEKNVKNTGLVIDSLSKNTPSKKEIREEMNQTMFNFLIYEDDFDKGKTSLSEIKSKINESK
jgi:hypothetical protein